MLQKGGGGSDVQPGVRGAQGAAQGDGQEQRRQAQTPPALGDPEDSGQGGLYRGTHTAFIWMQGQCIPDRCVPERKFLDMTSLVLFVPWTNHPDPETQWIRALNKLALLVARVACTCLLLQNGPRFP